MDAIVYMVEQGGADVNAVCQCGVTGKPVSAVKALA